MLLRWLSVIVIQLHFTKLVNNQNNFDANGNLLNLNNIGNLEWHYNNTLNKLTKANKPNTIQHYVYDYQGKRVRTVKMIECYCHTVAFYKVS
jgi:hypothetical protein